jgi:signal transduction histidine kinase
MSRAERVVRSMRARSEQGTILRSIPFASRTVLSATIADAPSVWTPPAGPQCSATCDYAPRGPRHRRRDLERDSEARAWRARILAGADDERRRIERDLHDGAQQRLVALRIRLELAAEAVAEGRADPVELLRELGVEAEVALEEVRSLAQGIYPAPLAALGLARALRSVAVSGAVPTTVMAEAGRRYAREVETAAYFCCLEAMQNAAKHAAGATGIRVVLSEGDGALGLEVRDDGSGFDPDRTAPGGGFTNIRDRLAAVGGELEVRSGPGAGTRVLAVIPL